MKLVWFDENISPKFVRALKILQEKSSPEVKHIKEQDWKGKSDTYLVENIAKETGSIAIVTCDKDFSKRHELHLAAKKGGLQIVQLPKKFAQTKARLQVAYFLLWWGKIEEALQKGRAGDIWKPKWDIRESKTVPKHLKKVRRGKK